MDAGLAINSQNLDILTGRGLESSREFGIRVSWEPSEQIACTSESDLTLDVASQPKAKRRSFVARAHLSSLDLQIGDTTGVLAGTHAKDGAWLPE